MKTSKNAGRFANLDPIDLEVASRRKRTKTSPACESLEGRKLMTGASGLAAGLAGSTPAAMTDMGGGGFAGMRTDHFRADANLGGQTSWTPDATMMGGGGDLGSRSFRPIGDNTAGVMGRPNFGGGSMFAGGANDMGRSGNASFPMSGQIGSDKASGATAPDSQLQTDITKLQTDAQAIHDKSQVTPALEASVRKDNEAIDKAKTGTADASALKTLQTDEQTIFSTQTGQSAPTPPTDAQQAQLQADHDAVLKSQGVSQTLIDQLAADQLAVKTASNFTATDQATIDADRKAVEADRASATTPTNGGDSSSGTTTSASSTANPPMSVASTTTSTSDATAATATAATPDSASASASPAAVAVAVATPTDPTATPTTSTAAPTMMAAPMASKTMAAPTTTPGHHLRAGMARHAGSMHQIEHATSFSRRAPRN